MDKRPGTARPGTARPGTARPGTARPGTARQRPLQQVGVAFLTVHEPKFVPLVLNESKYFFTISFHQDFTTGVKNPPIQLKISFWKNNDIQHSITNEDVSALNKHMQEKESYNNIQHPEKVHFSLDSHYNLEIMEEIAYVLIESSLSNFQLINSLYQQTKQILNTYPLVKSIPPINISFVNLEDLLQNLTTTNSKDTFEVSCTINNVLLKENLYPSESSVYC